MTKLTSRNPATNEVVWEGTSASQADVDQAVKRGRTAFGPWSLLPLQERFHYLEAFAQRLKDEKLVLAEAISKEVGKPLWESTSEVEAMMKKVPLSYEAYQLRCAERMQPLGATASLTRHKPHGVIAVLGPFNFPGHLPNGHIIPALLAGNTIVFKPSEHAPLTGEITLRCWQKAGLPEGVLNVVQGARDTGGWLANHADIDGLFFTGSWPTGLHLSQLFASHPEKILALELGGNNPLVVTHVSDLKAAAYITIQSAYLTAGQRCSCARRLILLEDMAKPFLQTLISLIHRIQVGSYTDRPEPFMGPVISPEAANGILKAHEILLKKGGKSLVDLQLLTPNTAFLRPGLIDVTGVKDIPDEEIFGPLLQVIRVNNFAEAIVEANRTSYGLTAGLLSDNRAEFEQFYREARAGVINWNAPLTGASSAAPFGGLGRSGNHRPSGFYAGDYCSYPVASMECKAVSLPSQPIPGLTLNGERNLDLNLDLNQGEEKD